MGQISGGRATERRKRPAQRGWVWDELGCPQKSKEASVAEAARAGPGQCGKNEDGKVAGVT